MLAAPFAAWTARSSGLGWLGEHAVVQARLATFGRRALALEFFAGLEHR